MEEDERIIEKKREGMEKRKNAEKERK